MNLMTLELTHVSWMLGLRLVQASLALVHPHAARPRGSHSKYRCDVDLVLPFGGVGAQAQGLAHTALSSPVE